MNPEISQTQSMKSVRAFDKVSTKIKEMIFKGVMKPVDRPPLRSRISQPILSGPSVRQ